MYFHPNMDAKYYAMRKPMRIRGTGIKYNWTNTSTYHLALDDSQFLIRSPVLVVVVVGSDNWQNTEQSPTRRKVYRCCAEPLRENRQTEFYFFFRGGFIQKIGIRSSDN